MVKKKGRRGSRQEAKKLMERDSGKRFIFHVTTTCACTVAFDKYSRLVSEIPPVLKTDLSQVLHWLSRVTIYVFKGLVKVRTSNVVWSQYSPLYMVLKTLKYVQEH